MKTSSSSGGGRNATTRPLKGPGSDPVMSAMVGGVGNRTTNPSAKKGAQAFNRGGMVQGGFRNRGMARKR